MKITISGDVGSGKSTVAKIIAKELGYKHYSTGDFMRALASERGITLNELGKLAQTDNTIDKTLDGKQEELGKKEDDFVVDARLGYHFIPDSIKIFLRVDIDESVRRVMKDKRKAEAFKNAEQAKEEVIKRMEYEKLRYKKYYNIAFPDLESYDILIDTTDLTPKDVVKKILSFLEAS